MYFLFFLVIIRIFLIFDWIVFFIIYWIVGLLIIGSIFFGWVLVVGKNFVLRFVVGIIVFFILFDILNFL